MAKEFFMSWQLWEKMVFVLACSIVVTILAGCVKLLYSHYRLRGYARNPAAARVSVAREKSIMRSLSRRSTKKPMSEKQVQVTVDDGVEIPFGIRAIESGIEVDGVWISRSNTPLQLPSRHSSGSLAYDGIPDSSSLSEFSPARTETTMTSSPESQPIMKKFYSRESKASEGRLGDTTSGGSMRYPPHSYMRYEHGKHPMKARATSSSDKQLFRRLSGYDSGGSIGRWSGEGANRNSSASSDESSSNSQDMVSAQGRAISLSGLDMLQAHRLSHAAETGQLVPRERKPGGLGGELGGTNSMPKILSGESDKSGVGCTATEETSSGEGLGWKSFRPLAVERSNTEPSMSGSSFSGIRREGRVLRDVNSGFSILRPGTLEAEALARGMDRGRAETAEKRQSRRLQKRRGSNERRVTRHDSTESSQVG